MRETLPETSKYLQTKGFTLIELLVSLVLIGIIVGGGIVSFRNLNKRQAVEAAAQVTEQAIRTAQKNATAGVKPAGWCTDPETLDYYWIRTRSPSEIWQYEIRAYCSDNSWRQVQVGSLPQGTRFRFQRTIHFSVLDGQPGGPHNAVEVCHVEDPCNPSGGLRIEISVSPGGSVHIQEL